MFLFCHISEESMLAVQEYFHFCAKYSADVLLSLSTFITVVRQCLSWCWICRSFSVWACNCCECCYFLGVLQAALNPGYWSSSSTSDNPIKVLNFALCFWLLGPPWSLHPIPPSPPNKQPPTLTSSIKMCLFAVQLLVQMTTLLSSFV